MSATILVAEDEPFALDLLATFPEDEGHCVLRARDGAEALARLDRDRPDLLLTDYRMPHLSGVDLLALMRAEPEIAVPAILLSAYAPAPLPGVPVLAKPFEIEQVLAAVAGALAAPPQHQREAQR